MGKSTINGPFSMAMLHNQRVYTYIYIYISLNIPTYSNIFHGPKSCLATHRCRHGCRHGCRAKKRHAIDHDQHAEGDVEELVKPKQVISMMEVFEYE